MIVPHPAGKRGGWPARTRAALFTPVDVSSIVFFRIAFGAMMLWEVYRYFDHGWIPRYYIEPQLLFKYHGFEWVTPWPGDGMYVHFLALGALAACILVGFHYRISAALFFLGFAYVFLLAQTRYLNHFYLILLASFLLIFVPAGRAFSIDARLNPGLRSDTAPGWALWLLRAQIGIPYFYGGVAKLNGDWLRGEPMRMWLAERMDVPVIGPFLGLEGVAHRFAIGGLLFDLLVVPLLLWRRTRLYAFVAAVGFHLLNAALFKIGIFPWFMILATVIFLPPDLPRRIAGLLWKRANRRRSPATSRDAVPAAASGNAVQAATLRDPAPGALRASAPGRERVITALVAAYLAVQVVVPLRHLLYPGNVSWTEEGHRFAWHMKLRDKEAGAVFVVTDPASGKTWTVHPSRHLTPHQQNEMTSRPGMILQFSHFLAEKERRKGYESVEVRAFVMASLNGRPPQLLIDPTVDLARERRRLLPQRWIVPLTEALPAGPRVSYVSGVSGGDAR